MLPRSNQHVKFALRRQAENKPAVSGSFWEKVAMTPTRASLVIYYWKGGQWNRCPLRFDTNAQVRAEVARIGLAGFRAVVSSVHLGAPMGEPEAVGEEVAA